MLPSLNPPPFFSFCGLSSGGHRNKASPQVCLPTTFPTPVFVSPSMFDSGKEKEKELQTYIRRDKDKQTYPPQITSWDPGNDSFKLPVSLPVNPSVDYDRPIALRKGKHTCTNHPICNFFSYQPLSNPYRTFVNSVSSVKVPTSLKEAMSKVEWRNVMVEEMKALEKNGT